MLGKDCLRIGLAAALMVSAMATATAGEIRVEPREVDDLKAVIATVEPLHQLAARARIGGTILQLRLVEGDRVAAGQVVATVVDQKIALQMAALDQRIQSAAAQLDQARIDYDRTAELQKVGAAAQSLLDQRKTNLDVAERALTALKADRQVLAEQGSEGDVLAPTSGRVLKLAVTEGTVVLPGETIATLAEDQYILRLQLPERHAAIIRAGDTLQILGRDGASAQTGAQIGTVRIVYPEIEGGRVIADVDVAGLGSYFVGERTRVNVPTGKRSVIVIPASAVTLRAGLHYVRLKDGTEVVVQPGETRAYGDGTQGEGVEILSGLQAGDVVATP